MVNADALRSRSFMPTFSIPQLRSRQTRDFGAGNVTAFKRLVNQLIKVGIRHICLQPIHETKPGMASLFSRTSSNALSLRLLDLAEIPEISKTPCLSSKLQTDLQAATEVTAAFKTNLALVEVMHQHYLNRAFRIFNALPRESQRKAEFSSFCKQHSWWLDNYAYFKALNEEFGYKPMDQWDKSYSDPTSDKALLFMVKKSDRINYFKYCQMETYRQVKAAFSYAKEQGIEEIEALIGVGVARESAEGFLMPEIFDASRQIGCFPEPENGYPIQLWGFLAERSNDSLLDFKVRSFRNISELGVDRIGLDHACGFLGGYTTFPVHDPVLAQRGSFRLLDASDPMDAEIAEKHGTWSFAPRQEEDKRKAFAQRVLFTLLEKVPGIKFTAETVGDKQRREAAETAIANAIEKGHALTLMRSLPWEDQPLSEYEATDRLSLTHDMPALIGLLTGQAGYWTYPWINAKFVKGLLNKFGILAPQLDEAISPSELTQEFMLEIHRRIIGGSNAGTVVIPLASLFTLDPKHLNSGKWQYTNVQPGTTGEVNNLLGNWEQRLPETEDMIAAEETIATAVEITSRPFGRVQTITDSAENVFHAQIKQVAAESVVYQAANNNWTVWNAPQGLSPVMEFAVSYHGPEVTGGLEDKVWQTFKLEDNGIAPSATYHIRDLVTGLEFERTGQELIEDGLGIGLNTVTNRHHFVVCANEPS